MIENIICVEKGKFYLFELYVCFSVFWFIVVCDDVVVRKEFFIEGGCYLLEFGIYYKWVVNISGIIKVGLWGRNFVE